MADTPDPAAIARRLTWAQSAALQNPAEHVSTAYQLCGTAGLLSVMFALGRGLKNKGPRFEATALGREVRAELARMEARDA